MVTALPTLTLSAIYVLYAACLRERWRRQRLQQQAAPRPPSWHEFVVPPPEEGDVMIEQRLTVFAYLTRR